MLGTIILAVVFVIFVCLIIFSKLFFRQQLSIPLQAEELQKSPAAELSSTTRTVVPAPSGIVVAPKPKTQINQIVLVNYNKISPINVPVPFIVYLGPDEKDLIKKTIEKAKKMFSQSKLHNVQADTVKGKLQFEALEEEPNVKVELSYPEGTLKTDKKDITKRISQKSDTVFEFLMTPAQATNVRILVRIKYLKPTLSADGTLDNNKTEEIELLVIDILIKVRTAFGFNPQVTSVVTTGITIAVVIGAAILSYFNQGQTWVNLLLAGLTLIINVLGKSVDLTKLKIDA